MSFPPYRLPVFEPASARVLVVDDTEALRHAKSRVLRQAGFDVREAALGAQALEEAATRWPHLILLDMKLPDVSGLDVCRQVKAAHPEILILQTSANFVERQDRIRSLEGGADGYLTEPVDNDELIASVRALLRLKWAETELRRSETRFRATFEQAPVGMAHTALDGSALLVNARLAEILGYSREELLSGGIMRVAAGEQAQLDDVVAQVASGAVQAASLELPFIHKGGHAVWGSVTMSAVTAVGPGGAEGRPQYLVLMIEEITERKRYDAALRAADRRIFSSVLEGLTELIAALDLNGRYIAFNRAYRDAFKMLYGCDVEVGGTPADLLAAFPEEQARTNAVWARALDGETFTVVQAVGDERDRRHFEISSRPLRDEGGRRIGAIQIVRDVSERAAMEAALAASQAALQQAQKIEAVGQLTGGISHDFNNLLTAICGSLELLDRHVSTPAGKSLLAAANRAADRGAKLTEQLLAFSRKQHLNPQPADINAAVAGMRDMLLRTIGGTVEVETQLAPGLWPALTDSSQTELAILNLAINSRDAMPQGGQILIRTANVVISPAEARPELKAGDYVSIAVVDNGAGMPPHVLNKVFEPFFTTKEVGKGTGLGLSTVFGMTRQLGGDVRISSKVNEGTTVEILLPRAAEAPEAGTETEPERLVSSESDVQILVVDDDEEVRRVTVTCLRECGYRVVEAQSGPQALGILEVEKAIDLLVVDHAMPLMTGAQLARIVRQNQPDLPIIFVTGYADAEALADQPHGTVIIKKPFRLSTLAMAVRDTLAEAGIGQ